MPVNGLMLTLSSGDHHAARVLEAIQTRPGVEVGEIQNRWLPLVTDTTDDRGARDLHAWLESLAGVEQVDVILVGFDENPS